MGGAERKGIEGWRGVEVGPQGGLSNSERETKRVCNMKTMT